MTVIHTAHHRPFESQVQHRKRADDKKDNIKISRHFMLYVMHFVHSFVMYLL